jgi:hypothetical protein
MLELKGEIKFIHYRDGKEYHFVTAPNALTDSQMYSFNNWRDCYASDTDEVRSIVRGIHQKAKKIISSDFEYLMKRN